MNNLYRAALLWILLLVSSRAQSGPLRAGAYAMNITPTNFPVFVNGGFLARKATMVSDPLHARCVVFDNGVEKVAVVVADSCMLPRDVCDAAKAIIARDAGIPEDKVLIASTHTHTAPSAMRALGTPQDKAYAAWVPGRIAEGVARAKARLEPATVSWLSAQVPEYVACRRWIWRPGAMRVDPFDEKTVRANMHPGHQNPDAMGPSGPEDPELSAVMVRTTQGKPLALLANYGMHYFSGVKALSADYFARFANEVARQLGADEHFVGILSNGTSGDMWRRDYALPKPEAAIGIDAYAQALAERLLASPEYLAQQGPALVLAMAEKKLRLQRRVPDAKRLAWAQGVLDAMEQPEPRNKQEVYAQEAFWLKEHPEAELKLQALRLGNIVITAIPNEVYAITGLKLKALSPFRQTMNISLANGGEGYIPPPEQYVLGGYNTWPARSAGLDVQAEPRIVTEVLKLMEEVTGRPVGKHEDLFRPVWPASVTQGAEAWFSMHELMGPQAYNTQPGGSHGRYEDGVVFYLPGTDFPKPDRAAHFAGGRMRYAFEKAREEYSVVLWIWNAMPHDARPVTGYFLSFGEDGAADGDHFGIGGTATPEHAGKLIFYNGDEKNIVLGGPTAVKNRHWHRVRIVRSATQVRVFLDGLMEIDAKVERTAPKDCRSLFIGGRSDGFANFEGKIDEVGIW